MAKVHLQAPSATCRKPRDRQVLPRLARAVEYRASSGGPAQLVRVGRLCDDFDVGLKPVEAGEHPATALLGFTAPPEWWALGIAASGTATALPGADLPAGRHRVSVVTLMTRAGDEVTLLRLAPGRTKLLTSWRGGRSEGGFVTNVLRRALGLPSVGPLPRLAALTAILWLQDVARAAANGEHLRWEAVAALHPAATAIGEPRLWRGERLMDAGRELEELLDWDKLRRVSLRQGAFPWSRLPRHIIEWSDGPLFAALVMEELPPLAELTATTTALLDAPVAARVRAALDAWGLPGDDINALRPFPFFPDDGSA